MTESLWPDGVNIKIEPKPPIEAEDEKEENPHKAKRKKRKPKNDVEIPSDEVEEAFKAYPTRFVRLAQKGLEEGIYDEVWAVFDLDGHPRQEEAFKLAEVDIDGKHVNVAFSSIAFEHWILLHFERNNYPFSKSQCKDAEDGNKVIPCGTNIHAKDCKGEYCVSGYIAKNKYLPELSKGAEFHIYRYLEKFTERAMANAAWLSLFQAPEAYPYEINPYSSVGTLVQKLLQIPTDFAWVKKGNEVSRQDIKVGVNTNGLKFITISIINVGEVSKVVKANLALYLDGKIVAGVNFDRQIIAPGDSREFYVSIFSQARNTLYDQASLIINNIGEFKIHLG